MTHNVFLFFVIAIIIVAIITAIVIAKQMHTRLFNNKQECMTLKKTCDVRDRNCLIACTLSNGQIYRKCYTECQAISPVC